MTVTLNSRRLKVACLAALIAMPAAVGCSGGGSQFALNPKRIALREQLSRLEYQNQQLKDELAVAQQDTKRLNNDLQLAEIDNKDLERRLDSFRTQVGLNAQESSTDDALGMSRQYFGGGGAESGSTRPASQPPNRAAPFTRIPNPSRMNDSPPPGPSIENRARSSRSLEDDRTISPRLDLPPVQYFDLNPSASRREASVINQASTRSSSWSPLDRGSTRRQ